MIADGEPLPAHDVHYPLLSLPYLFRTTLATVPAEIPYLKADPRLVENWKQRLAGVPGLRVGICWQGNRDFAYDRYRSVPLRFFRKLAAFPGVTLISLQKGDGTEQLTDIDFDVLTFPDMDTEAGTFMDTAAIMRNLDLVVSSDTATPHLAGALGVPVWLATSFAAEWRWMVAGDSNPWYPTMRLFRQEVFDEWAPVFDHMAEELERLLKNCPLDRDTKERAPLPHCPSEAHSGPESDTPTVRSRPQANRLRAISVEISPGELLDKLSILQIKLERIHDPQKLANVV